MEKTAVHKDGLVIPLIDFAKFLSGDAASRAVTARAILHGFQTAGFVYLSGIPIGRAAREAAFAASAAFFRLPMERKLVISWTTPEANRGFSAPGREKNILSGVGADEAQRLRAALPDLKESLEIGREGEPDHPNRWPDEHGEKGGDGGDDWMTGFRDTMRTFFEQCRGLHVEVMRAIAVGMGLEERYFDRFVDVGDNTLRLLYYPEVPRAVFRRNPGQLRTGEHSDYGSITLLFQDDRGGLQVRGPEGTFVDAAPIEDTCVVNAGDLLARWSNDTIKSTLHRVVEPPASAAGGEDQGEGEDGEMYPARYSIAYFCNPNFKDYIEAIPGTYASEADKKYEGINSGEYLVQRLTATY